MEIFIMDNNTQLQTYADLIKYEFNNMVSVKLPEFWWESVTEDIQADTYYQNIITKDFKDETGLDLTVDDNDETMEKYAEFETEWIDSYFDGVYITYVVDGYNLDKLPAAYDVFWNDDLESYIFLQTWFGMSAGMLTLPDIEN